MKRILLFSQPEGEHFNNIETLLFPKELSEKKFAYMPSDGANSPAKYEEFWEQTARNNQAEYNLVNNSLDELENEQKKIMESNILLISGGNTFQLLHNLRKSKLDHTIHNFIQKDDYVLSGFSAGALVLSPTIDICNLPNYDANIVNLEDLTGLGIIDFEVFSHFSEQHEKAVNDYTVKSKREIRRIQNNEYIVIDK